METIQLTNQQAQSLYHLAQDDMYDLIAAPSWKKKKRLMLELDKIGGFETDYCGKPDINLLNPYKNKNVKPVLVLYPEVKKWLKEEIKQYLEFLKTDKDYSNDTDWNGTKISLTNLLKKL